MIAEIKRDEKPANTDSMRIGIVASSYNSYIVDRLLDGCLNTLAEQGIKQGNILLVRVPGAFEIPVTVKKMVSTGDYDAIITLGAVIRGETPHFDYICNECARGITNIAIETQVPVIFGVLTVDDSQQALDRSGDEESNKGSESANTAIEMISVLKQI